MPLFLSKTGSAPSAFTKDCERNFSYTLTPSGAKHLRAVGVRNGQQFPAPILASLVRSGDAHSPRLAKSPGQVRFDFAGDDTSDVLPRCDMTGVTSDVHLVVYGDGSGTIAKLLGPEPRFVLQKVTQLSVPVSVLSLAAVGHLETAQKLPLKSPAAATLREWLRHDFENARQRIADDRARDQCVLALAPNEAELPLSEFGQP